MDLKKLQKNKIISDVFIGKIETDWSVLVYDKSAAKVMANLFTQSELITHNIVLSQRIEEEREDTEFPVVYFVSCSKETCSIINKEYQSKKYSSFRVCSLNEPEGINEEIMTTRIYMNYSAVEDKVFISSIPDIYSVAKTLNTQFYVEYTLKSLEYDCNKLDDFFEGDDRNGKVFVFDRTIDLYTPLAHFFTFQALLEDLELTDMKKIYEEYGDARLWKEVRYSHLGELNDIFKTYAHDVSANMKKLEGEVDTKELMKMVLSAPETLKTNEMLKSFFDLAGRCYESFEYLSSINETEQMIITGFDKSRNKTKVDPEEVFDLFESGNIEHTDKLRLFYLYKFSGHEYTREERKRLVELGFKDKEMEVKPPDFIYFKPLNYSYKYDYDVSRYEPTVSVVLREYLINKKKLIEIFKLKREATQFKSLRKSFLLSVKPDIHRKKIYIVYIRGGVTYPEISALQKLTDLLGAEILIGSDRIIRPKEFIDVINSE